MQRSKLLPALISFAEVAKQQSFTAAAKQLGLSKSAVSQQIKRLEAQLGQQLLSRHTRGMNLTAQGQRLLARCEFLQQQVDHIISEVEQQKERPSGRFSVTLPHSCELDIVIPAVQQLCVEFPEIEPHVDVSDQPKDLIQDKYDVAIYAGDLADSQYRALNIGKSQEVLCAGAAYLQTASKLSSPEQLLEQAMVAAPWQDKSIELHHELHGAMSLEPQFICRCNSLSSSLSFIEKGLGIGLIPEFALAQALRAGRVIKVLEDYRGKTWPFYFLHRFHGDKPVHVKRFYQLVKYYFEQANR